MVADTKVVDVRPVGHDKSVPVQVFLQPLGEEFFIRMERHSIVHARIDHYAQRSVTYGGKEWGEMFFAHVAP